MDDKTITLLISIILAIAGVIQVFALYTQNRQSRLQLINDYRQRWQDCRENWGQIVFIGRNQEEYYHVIDRQILDLLTKAIQQSGSRPTIWAKESVQTVCGIMSEVCLRILQGQLQVSEAYPIFGTELLRQSKPLRKLLESEYLRSEIRLDSNIKHINVRNEIQDWLVYHDGIRRRCLILLDLLWAEAVRLEDLPPSDMRSAAEAKCKSGKLNRIRVFKEIYRLKGFWHIIWAIRLFYFLYHAEYRSCYNWVGIRKKRLDKLESAWTERLLFNL